jgi:hypothetical protein
MSDTWTTTDHHGVTHEYDSLKNHVWVEIIEMRRDMAELKAQFAEVVRLLAAERQ